MLNQIFGYGKFRYSSDLCLNHISRESTDVNSEVRVFQGEIWMADLGSKGGNVQSGKRPVIVLQNDIGNKYSPTTIVVPLTSRLKKDLPVHADLGTQYGLKKVSTSLMEQITTINQSCLISKIGKLDGKGFEIIKRSIIESFKGIL